MPTFNFGFNDASTEISEGFSDYAGPLPPNGSYRGKLKLAKIVPMKKDATKKRIMLLVEIHDPEKPEFDGYPAFGGVNLTDQGIPFVNQFLRGLVPSDSDFEKIHRVFFGKGPVVDEKKENILKIGTVKIGSPEGEHEVLVQLKQEPYNGKINAKIQAFLPPDGGSAGGSSSSEEVVEEESAGVADELEEDGADDGEVEDGEDSGDVAAEEVGEEIFDDATT